MGRDDGLVWVALVEDCMSGSGLLLGRRSINFVHGSGSINKYQLDIIQRKALKIIGENEDSVPQQETISELSRRPLVTATTVLYNIHSTIRSGGSQSSATLVRPTGSHQAPPWKCQTINASIEKFFLRCFSNMEHPACCG